MAATYIEALIGSSTSTTTSWNPAVNTSAGNTTLVLFTSRGHTSSIAPCSITDAVGGAGWSLLHMSTDRKVYLWRKDWTSSMGGSVTVSGAQNSCAGVLIRLSDAGEVTNIVEAVNGSGTESMAGFTPDNADSMIFASVHNTANDNTVSSGTWATLGAPTDLRQHTSTGGSDCATYMQYKIQSGGPTGTGNFTWAQTNGLTTTLQFAVAPILGTLFELTASDTVTAISDSIDRALTFSRSLADTITTVTEAIVRDAMSKLRTTADTITSVTDSIVGLKTFIRSVVDTITTVTDSVARSAMSKLRTSTDTTSVSDAVARIADKVRTAVDNITVVTDSVVAGKLFLRAVTDTITSVTDSVARAAMSKLRAATDTTSITDSVSRVANKLRTVADTITTATDSVSRGAIAFVRSTTDTVVTSDTVVGVRMWLRTAADNVSGVTDSVVRIANKVRTAIDTVPSVTDVIQRIWTGVRSATDTLAEVTDSIATTVGVILYRTASDVVSIGADTINRAMSSFRTATDSLSVSDSVARVMIYARSAVDTLGDITDTVVRGSILFGRSVSDVLPSISDIVNLATQAPGYAGDFIKSIFNRRSWIVGRDPKGRVDSSARRINVPGGDNTDQVR